MTITFDEDCIKEAIKQQFLHGSDEYLLFISYVKDWDGRGTRVVVEARKKRQTK